MVLKGIPEELAHFASSILSSACIFSCIFLSSAVDTEMLIDHICEEADQLKTCRTKLHSEDSGAKSQAVGDDALAATGSEDKKKRQVPQSWQAGASGTGALVSQGEVGRDSSKAEKANKVQKSKTKPVGSANVVATPDEATDKCWAVDFSSGVPDPKDVIGCARRMKEPRHSLHVSDDRV